MLESIKRLLKGVTLVLIMEKEKTTIIETSFYDKQHGIISDENGEDWFTTTYFTWTKFINEVYESKSPHADHIYIKECEL